MNQLTSWLQRVQLSLILAILMVVLAFFQVEGYGKQLSALASEPLTPEATSYQVARPDAAQVKNRAKDEGSNLVENSQNKLKGLADNVRKKLNLDEPLPSSTKKFLNQAEDKVGNSVEPVTGNRSFYK